MSTTAEAETILAQYRKEIEMVVEHEIQRERSRNMNQMQALKAHAEQTKNELREEKGQIFSYLEEICELKLAVDGHAKRGYRAEEGQKHAE